MMRSSESKYFEKGNIKMSDIKVRNYEDARFWEWALRDAGLKNPWVIVDAKKALREFYSEPIDTERRVFNNDYDGATVVLPLPKDIKSAEEASEYFKEYEYIHYRQTYYDCTGQSFTAWYKVFQKPDGRFWAYHRIAVDC